MNYQNVYTVFVTKNLPATRDFYIKWFNFQVYFEASFFVLLGASGAGSYCVAFIDEVHPSSPPTLQAMDNKSGVFLTLQVEDAQMEYEKLKDADLQIYYHLKDEIWGQRRFGVIDPNGMYIDVVQQINPVAGFWEKYSPA